MDVEKLVWSLIPLLIIIAISWLFSYLGSKANKARQEAESVSGSDNRDRLLDLLSFEEEEKEEEMVGAGHAHAEDIRTDEGSQFTDWEAVHRRGAPVVSHDPIKPKWWGA
jgi:ABC-type nickel/cobalt efflux system permease component RcnA